MLLVEKEGGGSQILPVKLGALGLTQITDKLNLFLYSIYSYTYIYFLLFVKLVKPIGPRKIEIKKLARKNPRNYKFCNHEEIMAA